MNKKYLTLLVSISLLTGCSSITPANNISLVKENNQLAVVKPQPEIKKEIRVELGGFITTENNTVTFNLNLPKSSFQTKALDVPLFKFFRLKLIDSSGNIYYPSSAISDADPNKDKLVSTSDGGVINITMTNIKLDNAMVATMESYDQNKVLIPGTELDTAFSLQTTSKNVEISFRTTPTAKIVRKLIETNTGNSLSIARSLTLQNNLQNFIDTIIGVDNTEVFPNYTYTNHPAFINTDMIATDLLASGVVTNLSASNAGYVNASVLVSGTIKGLVATDTVSIQTTDTVSPILTGKGNGLFTNNVLQGPDWQTKIMVESGAGTTYTVTTPVATSANANVNLGDITLTPATPVITSVVAGFGKKDDEITITGTQFHSKLDGNVVKFGNIVAEITSFSNTELKVKVPDGIGIGGTVKVTVSVGTQTSNQVDFKITPVITTNSVSGAIGDEVTINGTGFSTTKEDNIVTIGGKPATVNSSTNNELKVVVPAGIYGTVNYTVKVGDQTSNIKTLAVTPKLTPLSSTDLNTGDTLNITGTGFDFNNKDNNKVNFGTTDVAVQSVNATGTQLTVIVPSVANSNITVKVGDQTSNGLAYNLLPTISITAPVSGATVNGTITLTASVTSPNTISKVEFFNGVASIGTATLVGGVYSYSWNTTTATSGAAPITAKVTDSAGKVVTSSIVNLTINQIPVVSSITASDNPVSGLGYPIQLTANATDDNTITYTWSALNNSGTFSNQNTNPVIWKAPSTAGSGVGKDTYTIQISVSDGVNPAVTKTLDVEVNNGTASVNVTGGAN